jgi:hypothetical protein
MIYPLFALALTMSVCVLFKRDDQFRSRTGEMLTAEQRIVARYCVFVITIVFSGIAYKTAKTDMALWKKKHRERTSYKKL